MSSPVSKKEFVKVLIAPVVAVVLWVLIMLFFMSGCAVEKTACKVVNVANDICMVLEYIGDDGKPHRVSVSREELQGLARSVAARDAAAKGDAGAK